MKRKYNNRTGHFWTVRDVALVIGVLVAIVGAVWVAFN